MSIKTTLINFIHEIFGDIETAIEPGIAYLKANVPAEAIKLAEEVITGALAGTSWSVLVQALLAEAEKAGVQLALQAADVALLAGKMNVISTGNTAGNAATTPVPVAPAVAPSVA